MRSLRWLRLTHAERLRIVPQYHGADTDYHSRGVPKRRAVPSRYDQNLHRSLYLLLPNTHAYTDTDTNTAHDTDARLPADSASLLQRLLRLPTTTARLFWSMCAVHCMFADSDGNAAGNVKLHADIDTCDYCANSGRHTDGRRTVQPTLRGVRALQSILLRVRC